LRYASGQPTKHPDVLIYHLCQTLHCLPSELDDEDTSLLERLARIDYIVQSKMKSEAESAKRT